MGRVYLQTPVGAMWWLFLVTQPQVAVPTIYFEDRGQESGKPDEVFPVSHRPIDTDTLFSPT